VREYTQKMTRILLLTSDGDVPDELVAAVAKRMAGGPVETRLLVPLHPVPDAWAWDEDATQIAMLERLDHAIARLRRAGARVEGTIGCDRDPMVCVNWVMEREPFDEVIVATPRSGRARLLRMDLAARIGRAFGLPVTHVPARSTPATA
jgi:nucleotide-binding universal stress UspA family protein